MSDQKENSMSMWDVTLSRNNRYGQLSVELPAVVSRALTEQGYNRVTVELTGQGILLRPYKATSRPARGSSVDLPFATENNT